MNNLVIDKYGKYWFNDEGEYHREDGPAVEDCNGYKAWYYHISNRYILHMRTSEEHFLRT